MVGAKQVTSQDVRRIASKLGNQAWVRHWFCLNYPQEPYACAIQLRDSYGKIVWLEKHAEEQMLRAGFKRETKYGIYGYHGFIDQVEEERSK